MFRSRVLQPDFIERVSRLTAIVGLQLRLKNILNEKQYTAARRCYPILSYHITTAWEWSG